MSALQPVVRFSGQFLLNDLLLPFSRMTGFSFAILVSSSLFWL